MSMEPFIGEIILFAGRRTPQGWMPCDGRLLPIQQYQALYSILGVTYGGDGTSNFALPDLRGRVPIGAGVRPNGYTYNVGTSVGQEINTLTISQLPNHNHVAKITDTNVTTSITLKGSTEPAVETSPLDAVPGVINRPGAGGALMEQRGYIKNSGNVNMRPVAVNIELKNVPVDVMGSGGGQPIDNRQPSLAMNYIIAIQGYYPMFD